MDDHTGTSISVTNQAPGHYKVDDAKLRKLAAMICASLGVEDLELGITLVDSDEIRRLNRDYRGKDQPTDVLSFPQQTFVPPLTVTNPRTAPAGDGPPEALGDVVISLAEAEANARKIGQSLDREVCFLIVHGILHLCGHDHEDPEDEAVMLAEQRLLMARLDDGEPAWASAVLPKTETASCCP